MLKYVVTLPDGMKQIMVMYKGSNVILKNGDIYDSGANLVKIFSKYFEPFLEESDNIIKKILEKEDINTIEKDVIIEID